MLAPPSNAVPIKPVSEVLKPRNEQATSRMNSPSIIPLTAPIPAKAGATQGSQSHHRHRQGGQQAELRRGQPCFALQHGEQGPTEARMGRRFSPTIKAIIAKSNGDVRFNMASFSGVNGPGKLPRAFILTLR